MARHEVDLLIVGGGIYGAVATYEAARRGLSVLLVDRADFGEGASSNSMKIAHGGLRYLQDLDPLRSLESVRERRRLCRLVPQWIRPLPVRFLTAGRSLTTSLQLRAGLWANEILSVHRNRRVPRSNRIPRSRFPYWYDAIIDDTERVLLAFLHSAIRMAPDRIRLANHSHLGQWIRENGQLRGAQVAGVGEVRCRAVVRCTGPGRGAQPPVVSMNLVIDALPLTKDGVAVALFHPDEGRNVFAVPWRGRTIVGTYNRSYPYDPAAPFQVDPSWVDECLAWVRPAHPELAVLKRQEVRLVHAGPLPGQPGGAAEPARRAWARLDGEGILDVQGVKWTTVYGVVARALDRVSARLGASRVPRAGEQVARLTDGCAARDAFLRAQPQLTVPLVPGASLTEGDVRFSIEQEWARTIADVLLRRTATATRGHPGLRLVEEVSRRMQRLLDWTDAVRRRQVEAFNEDFRFAGNITPGPQ